MKKLSQLIKESKDASPADKKRIDQSVEKFIKGVKDILKNGVPDAYKTSKNPAGEAIDDMYMDFPWDADLDDLVIKTLTDHSEFEKVRSEFEKKYPDVKLVQPN